MIKESISNKEYTLIKLIYSQDVDEKEVMEKLMINEDKLNELVDNLIQKEILEFSNGDEVSLTENGKNYCRKENECNSKNHISEKSEHYDCNPSKQKNIQKSFKELKREKMIFRSPSVPFKKYFNTAMGELIDGEIIVAMALIGEKWTFASAKIAELILTNKRLMVRSYGRVENLGNFDIQYGEIDRNSFINPKLANQIYLIARGKKYNISFNLRNKKFIDTIKNIIDKQKSLPDTKNVIFLRHIEGIPFLSDKMIAMGIGNGTVLIHEHITEKTYKIPIKNIKDIIIKSKSEITENEKNIIGRSLAGGILFGGAGAMVGAISGSDNKKIQQNYFLVLKYRSKEKKHKEILFYMECSESKHNLIQLKDDLYREINKKSSATNKQNSEIKL